MLSFSKATPVTNHQKKSFIRRFLSMLLAVGILHLVMTGAAVNADTVIYTDFSDVSDLTLNGSAGTIGNPVLFDGREVLRLTDTYHHAGSAFLTNPIVLENNGSFSTSFQFQITDSGGLEGGADGLVFVIQTMGNNALGRGGGYLGYQNINPSIGVEFDTYNNSWDSNGNHIGINLDGSVNSVARYNVATSLNNGNVWYAWIDLDGATDLLEVRLSETSSRPANAQLSYTVDLSGIMDTSNVFAGFTGATYNGTGDHDIITWQFITFPNSHEAPTLVSPVNNSTLAHESITFEWSAVDAAVGYEILVDNNAGFGSPEINEPGIHVATLDGTEYTVTNWLPNNLYYWKVRAKFGKDNYSDWSDTWQFTYQLPVWSEPVWVPLYRLYKNSIHDHYYTTIPAHRDSAQSQGYAYEKIECYISDRKFDHPDCGYLFRLCYTDPVDPSNVIHLYTSNEAEKDNRITSGFNYEGIVGFICLEHLQGGVSFYRLYHDGKTDNFYTVSAFERENAKSQWDFVEAGDKSNADGHKIVGYASPDGLINPSSRLKLNANVGRGINTGNGNLKLYEHTDFNIPGINIPLIFARTYNSLNCGVDGPIGYGWTHSFDAVLKDDGTYVFVRWPDGHVDYYKRDGSNMTPDNPAQASNQGCYDTIHQKSDGSYSIIKKDQTQYVFMRPEGAEMNAPAQFRSIIEKNGKSISFWYEDGNLLWVQDTAVRRLNFTYYTAAEGHAGHIKEITDPIGRTITFEYDENDNLTGFADARGNKTTCEYDGNHQLTKVIYPEGNKLTNTYENLKLVSQKMGNAVNPITLEYESSLTTVTDPYGKQSDFNVTDCQLASIKDSLGNTAYFTFGNTANPTKPTQVEDKNGNITTYAYKDGATDTGKKVLQRGNLLSVKNVLNEETLFEYDDKNNLIKKTDPLNHVTINEYDANKRNLIKITYPEGGIQNITYTANGQIETVTNPNGHTTYYTYNTHGDVTRITDHLGNRIDFTYDGVGRGLTKTDQLGRVTAYSYDGNDNPVSVIDADTKTTSYIYGQNNNLTTITDARGKETVRTYNDRDLLATETDAAGKTYEYSYDDKGNLVSVTDHDNNQTTYTYDDNNRLTAIRYNGTIMVSFSEYDANGNLKKVFNSNGETSFVYDALNRISSCNGTFGKTVSYEYDAAGNRTKIIYPGEGKDVDYEYDADNRLVKVTDWLNGEATYAYDNAGILQSFAKPNGTTTSYTYDNADRLTGLVNRKSDNTVIADYSFTLDGFGNHTQVVRNEPLAPAFSASDVPYAYDDANRLTSAGSTTYTHDNRGNMIGSSAGDVYNFDYADRLTDVTIGGSTILYLYDGLGNRIARTEGGVQTRYVLDLNGLMSQALAETDSAGNVTSYYVYGHGLISKITSDGQRYCYHYDSRGSAVAITDDSENIVNSYVYDEFGDLLAENKTIANPFKYVGRHGVMDEENGLLFMRARYYDVGTGRFLSKDPLGFGGGDLNLYAYVGNNPVMGLDPSGLMEYGGTLYELTYWVEPAYEGLDKAFTIHREKADEWYIGRGPLFNTHDGVSCTDPCQIKVGGKYEAIAALMANGYIMIYDTWWHNDQDSLLNLRNSVKGAKKFGTYVVSEDFQEDFKSGLKKFSEGISKYWNFTLHK